MTVKIIENWYWFCPHFTEKILSKIHYEEDSVIEKIKSRV